MANVLALPVTIAVLGFLVYHFFLRKPKKNLPPGPKGLPLLGNIFDLPSHNTPNHLHWLKHKDIYGPISSVKLLGQPLIILHGHQEIQEILNKTSLMTGSRPVLEFANYCGFGRFIVSIPLNEKFKVQRKLMGQAIGTKSLVAKYADVLEVEVRRLIIRTLRGPEGIVQHLKTLTAATMLKIIYGYTIEPNKPDPLVEVIDQVMAYFSSTSIPFNRLMDFIPAVRYLPDSLPGMRFKQIARDSNNVIQTALNVPYDFAREQMATHNRMDSSIAKFIGGSEEKAKSAHDIEMAKWTAGTLYAGGSDTTDSTLAGFVFAMTRFPSVQSKAQAEIDAVTDGSRLPNLQDRENMPYIEAITSEILRWFPVVPLSLPHVASEDLTYNGYDLPKGAIIIPSIWWINRDPEVYADPEVFEPERFLSPRNEPDPRHTTFGFGRRICPGRHLVEASLFLSIAHLLAVFDIRKPMDPQDQEIVPQINVKPGVIMKMQDFPFKIVPRSEKHRELILEAERHHGWDESDSSHLRGVSQLVDLGI